MENITKKTAKAKRRGRQERSPIPMIPPVEPVPILDQHATDVICLLSLFSDNETAFPQKETMLSNVRSATICVFLQSAILHEK